jgi:hypothetical protein
MAEQLQTAAVAAFVVAVGFTLRLLLPLTPLSQQRSVVTDSWALCDFTVMLLAPARMLLSNISHRHSVTLNACSSRQQRQQQLQG